jgi:hypothetical protein
MKVREGFEYFRCRKCGAILREDQRPYDEKGIVYPTACYEEQGGCGRDFNKTNFLRLKKEFVENPKMFKDNEES